MNKIDSLEDILNILPSYYKSEETYLLEDESLCPCGENKKFKDCCLDKFKEVSEKYSTSEHGRRERQKMIEDYLNPKNFRDIPSIKLYKTSLERKYVKFCLASDSSTPCSNEGSVFAHTLAESSVLKVLSEKQKNLFTFNRYLNFPSDNLDDYFVSITTKKASIVNTFCKIHDQKLFKEIENGNVYKGEPLQELPLALNAAALRVYGLILQIRLLQKLLVELPVFWTERRLHEDYAYYIEKLKDSIKIPKKLVSDIENNRTSDLFTFNLELKDIKLPFVFCEGFDIDMDDFHLESIREEGNIILSFVNVFPSEEGTWISVSTFEEGKEFIGLLKEYEKENKTHEILQIIVDEIASQGSNIYFKEDYIKSLTEKEKAILYYKFTQNGAERIAEDIEKKYFSNFNASEKRDFYFKTLIKKY